MRKQSLPVLSFLAPLLFVVFSLTFLLYSFSKEERVLIDSFKIPYLKGNTDTTPYCLAPLEMLNAWYNVERMVPISDTIDLNGPDLMKDAPSYQFFIPEEMDSIQQSSKGLMLIVDTVNELSTLKKPIWARYLFHRSFDRDMDLRQDDTLIQKVKSFPIYLVNTSGVHFAPIELQDGSFIMLLEAKNKLGEWKPIEYWSNSWCGNSYYTVLIPPRHLMMSRGIKCSGEFSTLCRIKLSNFNDTLYSNVFRMNINENQFHYPKKSK